MSKPFSCLMGIMLLLSCGGGQPQVDRLYEEGVEVVLNHRKPYRLANEPSELVLEREFTIDTESPDLLEAGLTDIYRFAVDSKGFVYLTQLPRKDALVIFRFDAQGRFLTSFGRVGQGPGEIEGFAYLGINSRDDLFVLDTRRRKVLAFAPSGELPQETLVPHALLGAIPLETGSFLVPDSQDLPGTGFEEQNMSIYDPQFKKIKTFYRLKVPTYSGRTEMVEAYLPIPTGSISSNRIYIGMPGREYEVLVYDLDGTLLRKIRKEFEPIALTDDFRKETLARLPQGNPMAGRLHFPEYKPAFQYFFADEAGRLFVMTSERDKASGQNVCDIFDAAGVFIARAAVGYYDPLRLFWEGSSLDVVAKNGHIYVLHEKVDGFKELVVYKTIWR